MNVAAHPSPPSAVVKEVLGNAAALPAAQVVRLETIAAPRWASLRAPTAATGRGGGAGSGHNTPTAASPRLLASRWQPWEGAVAVVGDSPSCALEAAWARRCHDPRQAEVPVSNGGSLRCPGRSAEVPASNGAGGSLRCPAAKEQQQHVIATGRDSEARGEAPVFRGADVSPRVGTLHRQGRRVRCASSEVPAATPPSVPAWGSRTSTGGAKSRSGSRSLEPQVIVTPRGRPVTPRNGDAGAQAKTTPRVSSRGLSKGAMPISRAYFFARRASALADARRQQKVQFSAEDRAERFEAGIKDRLDKMTQGLQTF